jgi:hypothetical protein
MNPYLLPIASCKLTSCETEDAAGCAGSALGKATGTLVPAFWRLVSAAILMRDCVQVKAASEEDSTSAHNLLGLSRASSALDDARWKVAGGRVGLAIVAAQWGEMLVPAVAGRRRPPRFPKVQVQRYAGRRDARLGKAQEKAQAKTRRKKKENARTNNFGKGAGLRRERVQLQKVGAALQSVE